ncbi:MAG: NUDIX domain-containing protein [Patescibacteria group bacterium]
MQQTTTKIRAVAVVMHEGKILLMHRMSGEKEYYVFPGGKVEQGETPELAVLREILEEASMEVVVDKLLYHLTYDSGEQQYFYLCNHVSGDPKLGEGNEMEMMKTGAEHGAQSFNPVWHDASQLKPLLLYPLEVKDLLIEDMQTNYANCPCELEFKLSDKRESL